MFSHNGTKTDAGLESASQTYTQTIRRDSPGGAVNCAPGAKSAIADRPACYCS